MTRRLRLSLDPDGIPHVDIAFEMPKAPLGQTVRDAERAGAEPELVVTAEGFDSLGELAGLLVDISTTIARQAGIPDPSAPTQPSPGRISPRFNPRPRTRDDQ